MKKRFNHAIIGCGRIAQNHYNAATENDMAIVACCDRKLEKAKAFAEKNNIPYYTDNYKEFIDNDEIDSVSICTDHRSHTEIAKDFLNKKHMIIEKPLSSHLKVAKAFEKKCKESSKIVTVISQHRFDDCVNLVKEMVDDKVFGDITLVNASLICHRDTSYYKESYWRGTQELEGGSTIINQSFHMVDTLNYIFGLPKKVISINRNLDFKNIIDTEDTSVSIVDYEKFLCTIVSTNTSIQEWKTSIRIVGNKGDIEFNIDFPEEVLELNIDDEKKEKYKEKLEEIKKNNKKNLHSPANYYGLSHTRQFKNFKEAIINPKKLKVTVEKALETQEFISKIYD